MRHFSKQLESVVSATSTDRGWRFELEPLTDPEVFERVIEATLPRSHAATPFR